MWRPPTGGYWEHGGFSQDENRHNNGDFFLIVRERNIINTYHVILKMYMELFKTMNVFWDLCNIGVVAKW